MKYHKYSSEKMKVVEANLPNQIQAFSKTTFTGKTNNILWGILGIIGVLFFGTLLIMGSPGFWGYVIFIFFILIFLAISIGYLSAAFKKDDSEHSFVFIDSEFLIWGKTKKLNQEIIAKLKNCTKSEQLKIIEENSQVYNKIEISKILRLKIVVKQVLTSFDIDSMDVYTDEKKFAINTNDLIVSMNDIFNRLSQYYTKKHSKKLHIEASGVNVGLSKPRGTAIYTNDEIIINP